MIKDPAGTGKYVEAYSATSSPRQWLLDRLDQNGEPRSLEVHLFEAKLKTSIGNVILE
jgi:hypothetical protein